MNGAGSCQGPVGLSAGADHNSVIVTGTGSAWTNGNSIRIGSSASGNTMTISEGGIVQTPTLYVGLGGQSNKALVTGNGSILSNDSPRVGHGGSRNFIVNSTDTSLFDLQESAVAFVGGGSHANAITGLDLGSNEVEFVNANFGYGALRLGAAADNLFFISGDGASGNALHTFLLEVARQRYEFRRQPPQPRPHQHLLRALGVGSAKRVSQRHDLPAGRRRTVDPRDS